MLRKFTSLSFMLSLLFAGQAYAAKISVADVVTTDNNVGAVTTGAPVNTLYSDSTAWTDNYSTVTTLSQLVAIAPTATAPGLAYDYSTDTTTYNANKKTWKYDEVAISANSDQSKFGGGKTLMLEGTVTSTIDTTISFNIFAGGNYIPSNSPFGPSTPTLPSLFFGSSFATLNTVSHATAVNNTSNHEYGLNSGRFVLNISAGQTLSFAAAVYAPQDVSLGLLYLDMRSGNYDVVETSNVITSAHTQMIGAHVLAPVPEPETYAMLLAGLAVVGFARRKAAKNTA